MNLGLFLLVASLVVFLISAVLEFLKRDDIKIKLYTLVAMAFSNGVFMAVLSSYDNLTLMIWPGIFLIRIVSLATEVASKLNITAKT